MSYRPFEGSTITQHPDGWVVEEYSWDPGEYGGFAAAVGYDGTMVIELRANGVINVDCEAPYDGHWWFHVPGSAVRQLFEINDRRCRTRPEGGMVGP